MKKLDKNKRRYTENDDRDAGGHLYKKLRTEQQRKANNELDQLLKRKNFNFRHRDEDVDYL